MKTALLIVRPTEDEALAWCLEDCHHGEDSVIWLHATDCYGEPCVCDPVAIVGRGEA